MANIKPKIKLIICVIIVMVLMSFSLFINRNPYVFYIINFVMAGIGFYCGNIVSPLIFKGTKWENLQARYKRSSEEGKRLASENKDLKAKTSEREQANENIPLVMRSAFKEAYEKWYNTKDDAELGNWLFAKSKGITP